jgi:hypothetical protein
VGSHDLATLKTETSQRVQLVEQVEAALEGTESRPPLHPPALGKECVMSNR